MTPAKAGADWPDHVKQDFERNAFNGCVGDTLLSETDKVRVWKINLKPASASVSIGMSSTIFGPR